MFKSALVFALAATLTGCAYDTYGNQGRYGNNGNSGSHSRRDTKRVTATRAATGAPAVGVADAQPC